ncbi:MAG: hypothetical protein ACOWWH_02680 [Eubacteriaceae bacterium]
MSKIIMGIQVENRKDTITQVQNLLTDFGCYIKTRLGLHEASDNREVCSDKGLIILEFINDSQKEAARLEESLKNTQYVAVKIMEF